MAVAVASEQRSFALRRIRWRSLWTVLVAAFWSAILIGIIGGFFLGWNWTGFKENGKLWDWLGLLSAPVFVSALPFVFRGPRDHGEAKQPEQGGSPLAVTEERQQQGALEAYLDHMLELLLNKRLVGSPPGSEVREVARARTLTTLRRVGTQHKGEVLRFLCDAGLIEREKTIVDLRGADLRGADLRDVKLPRTNLSGVDLSGANLRGGDLSGADLSGSRLGGADTTGTNLGGATLNDVSSGRSDAPAPR
jgi:Pentapeptide repeats (8 copies)